MVLPHADDAPNDTVRSAAAIPHSSRPRTLLSAVQRRHRRCRSDAHHGLQRGAVHAGRTIAVAVAVAVSSAQPAEVGVHIRVVSGTALPLHRTRPPHTPAPQGELAADVRDAAERIILRERCGTGDATRVRGERR